MSYEPRPYTDEEILADWEIKAAHWENVALTCPSDAAVHCLDYAAHIRTMMECLRMDMLERARCFPSRRPSESDPTFAVIARHRAEQQAYDDRLVPRSYWSAHHVVSDCYVLSGRSCHARSL